jgi:hypothetical protein
MRCERLGPEHVDAVVAGYSDTCSQGLINPSEHWLTKIWPQCKRSPLKDIFHTEKKVTDELQQHHELMPLCCKLIVDSMIGYNDASRNHVVDLYMKESKTNMSRDVARDAMMERAKYTKKIKNFVWLPNAVSCAVNQAWKKIQEKDARLKFEAQARGDDYLPVILSPKKGV